MADTDDGHIRVEFSNRSTDSGRLVNPNIGCWFIDDEVIIASGVVTTEGGCSTAESIDSLDSVNGEAGVTEISLDGKLGELSAFFSSAGSGKTAGDRVRTDFRTSSGVSVLMLTLSHFIASVSGFGKHVGDPTGISVLITSSQFW
jgi:hypothetical protein